MMDNICTHMDAYKIHQIHIGLSGMSFSMKKPANIIKEFTYAKYNVYSAIFQLHNALNMHTYKANAYCALWGVI